jgi:GNAT superfamily N-acetyltransferase
MSNIRVIEVIDKRTLKKFVSFPHKLFADNPYWVPPLIVDEMEVFDRQKNPVFEHASAKLFLAYKDREIVGRIACLINFNEVEKLGIPKMRFGWFDVIDDLEVTKALLKKVHEIGRENKLNFVEGPLGFTNLDKVGVLTKGFDQQGDMVTWYSPKYYAEHFQKLGYETAQKWSEYYFDVNLKADRMQDYRRMAEIVKRRYELKVMRFTKKTELLPYVDKVFDLFQNTYSTLPTFVPLSEKEILYVKNKYLKLVDPEFIKYVEDKDGHPVAFAITMRSFSQALKKAGGKLFPFGIFHLLKAKKNAKEVMFYLIGIHPNYQKKGVAAIIFDEFAKTYVKHGITKAYRTPELDSNESIKSLWKEFNPINHKGRKTLKKEIINE